MPSFTLINVSSSSGVLAKRRLWPYLLLFAFAYAADSATSLALLASHGWEINPLLRAAYTVQGAAGFLALKALFAILVVVAALSARHVTRDMPRMRWLAPTLLWLGSVTWLLWAFLNLAALSAA